MQAIRTHYCPATNNRGSRIIATASAGKITVSYDYALNADQNHAAAAKKLASKFGWTGSMVGGTLADNSMCFVFTNDLTFTI